MNESNVENQEPIVEQEPEVAEPIEGPKKGQLWVMFASILGLVFLFGGLNVSTMTGNASGNSKGMGCGGFTPPSTKQQVAKQNVAPVQSRALGTSNSSQKMGTLAETSPKPLPLPELMKQIQSKRKLLNNQVIAAPKNTPTKTANEQRTESPKPLALPEMMKQIQAKRLRLKNEPQAQPSPSNNGKNDKLALSPPPLPLPQLMKQIKQKRLQAASTK